MSLFNLSGKTALITGSSRGIGYAIATALGQAGARIILNGRNEHTLEAAASELRNVVDDVETALFDVTEQADVNQAISKIEESTSIDILVNNAGIQRRAPLDEFDDDDWRELMKTNLDSVYYVSKAVARNMIPRKSGKIINIASVMSELARPTIAPYTASKGGVKNLTKGMCADWARHGIQINAIGPGYFETPLNKALVEDAEFDTWLRNRTPAGRWGKLEDLHGIAVFLASPASDFVNGQTMYVDGGITSVV